MMHQEYAGLGDTDNQKIGDKSWVDLKTPSGAAKLDKEAPPYAPFYWGVKDGKDPAMLRKVRQFVKIPYFMDAEENYGEVMGSPEFWFSRPGAGAKAHMDSHCESTMTIQLDGSKRWRIGLAADTNHFLRGGTYSDGEAYKQRGGWVPTYDFILNKGEALFFPPAFIHESQNIGEECAASITHQYNYPMAAGFFRAWWPRTRRIGDMNECWPKISSWATLGQNGAQGEHGDAGIATAGAIFRKVDTSQDGSLNKAEIAAFVGRQSEDLHHKNGQSSLDFHDTDQDGKVTSSEFMKNYALWSRHEAEVTKETRMSSWMGMEGGDGDDGADEDQDGEDQDL